MVSFSSITGGIKKGWSLFKAVANKTTVDNIVKKGGNAHISSMGQDVEIPVPENRKNIKVSSDITSEELGSYVAESLQDVQRAPLTEAPDPVLKAERALPKITNPQDDLQEPRDIAYYPAGKNPYGRGNEGKKPNIEAIRQWVTNTKVGNASNITLSEEFGEEFGFIGWGFTEKELDKAIDEVTFKVARKIWYVGRKPASMTDIQWDEATKEMRPAEGSFSKNEKWANGFPYGETYKYQSGKLN
tara:strand:+ start:520 stop:1251 length:732 start_codon:yes stop_codon:yes gene_type:complete